MCNCCVCGAHDFSLFPSPSFLPMQGDPSRDGHFCDHGTNHRSGNAERGLDALAVLFPSALTASGMLPLLTQSSWQVHTPCRNCQFCQYSAGLRFFRTKQGTLTSWSQRGSNVCRLPSVPRERRSPEIRTQRLPVKAVPALTSFLLIVMGFPACAVAGAKIARPRDAGTRRRKGCEKSCLRNGFGGNPAAGQFKASLLCCAPCSWRRATQCWLRVRHSSQARRWSKMLRKFLMTN